MESKFRTYNSSVVTCLSERYIGVKTTLFRSFPGVTEQYSRSHWPRGLRRRSAAARLLRFWVQIPPGSWLSLCCVYCMLSGRGLCDGLITLPEQSYRLWCVVVCYLETS